MYFNMFTGEISGRDGDNMLKIAHDWFPYHNIKNKYVGFKSHTIFAKPTHDNQIKHVNTYEEMNW